MSATDYARRAEQLATQAAIAAGQGDRAEAERLSKRATQARMQAAALVRKARS